MIKRKANVFIIIILFLCLWHYFVVSSINAKDYSYSGAYGGSWYELYSWEPYPDPLPDPIEWWGPRFIDDNADIKDKEVFLDKSAVVGKLTGTILDLKNGTLEIGKENNVIIRGYGVILPHDGSFSNKGIISASGGTLRLCQGFVGTIVNQGGTLQTEGSGDTLLINGIISGGIIYPGLGVIDLHGATLENVELKNGTVIATGSHVTKIRGTESTSAADIRIDSSLEFEKDAAGNQPVFTNSGTITTHGNSYLHTATSEVVATLAGTGTVELQDEGSISGPGTFVNEGNHTIRGKGNIRTTLINRGNIIAEGVGLNIHLADINNEGEGSLSTAGKDNSLVIFESSVSGGSIKPNGGFVGIDCSTISGLTIGAENQTWSTSKVEIKQTNIIGDLNIIAQSQSPPEITILNPGINVYKDDQDRNPTIYNEGMIKLSSTTSPAYFIAADGSEVTLSGPGTLLLEGNNSVITQYNGGKLVNESTHTIGGSGTIDAPIINEGQLVAYNGVLEIKEPVTGRGSIDVGYKEAPPAPSKLEIKSNVEAGNVYVYTNSMATLYAQDGGTLSAGSIQVIQGGTFEQTGGSLQMGPLNNAGTMNFAGGEVEATGRVTNHYSGELNISIDLTFTGPARNDGTIKVTDAEVHWEGGFTGDGLYISDPSDNYFTNLTIGENGYIIAGEGDRFFISNDFTNNSRMDQAWETSLAQLIFTGESGTAHEFTIAGMDACEDKFKWRTLDITNQILNFSGSGTLFVGELLGLEFDETGEATNLKSALNVCYDLNLPGNEYLEDRIFTIPGGGQVVPTPVPPSVLLLGSGLLGLAAWRGSRFLQ